MERVVSTGVCLLILALNAGEQERDFISLIKSSPETREATGIQKLSAEEQKALNVVFDRVYAMGFKDGMEKAKRATKEPEKQLVAPQASKANVFITKIDDENGDVLKLANGAIVEISSGFLGLIGFSKDAVLFRDGYTWKIWIEGKKVFKCDLLKPPSGGNSGTCEKVYISEVRGEGSILIMLDGSIYEVDSIFTIDSSLWLGNSDALLIDGSRLLNLDEGGEIVDVTRIK